jgi:hypothetical protein
MIRLHWPYVQDEEAPEHATDARVGNVRRRVRGRHVSPCCIVTLGAVNRRRILPGLARAARDGTTPGRAEQLMRRTITAELVPGAAALAVTGALAGYAP